MATAITHIVLAAKIYDKLFSDKNKQEFFVGNLFPDIRYLTGLDRSQTHFPNLTLADAQREESFLAGVKLHALVDVVRQKFIVDNDVYSLCPKSKYITQSLKILEDELFYQHIDNWQEYIDYFNGVLPDETNFGVTAEATQRWHTLLQQYFQQPPNEQSVTAFALGIGFSNEVAQEINRNVAEMRTNKQIVDILQNLYTNFDTLI